MFIYESSHEFSVNFYFRVQPKLQVWKEKDNCVYYKPKNECEFQRFETEDFEEVCTWTDRWCDESNFKVRFALFFLKQIIV